VRSFISYSLGLLSLPVVKIRKWFIAKWKSASFSQEKKVPFAAQQKAVFALETHTELTKEKTSICEESQLAYPLFVFQQLAAFSAFTLHQKL